MTGHGYGHVQGHGHGIPDGYLDGYARILAAVASTGRRLTRDELLARRELGEQAAEAGFGLRALVGAHLAGARVHWPSGASGAEAAEAADRVLAAVEQAVD